MVGLVFPFRDSLREKRRSIEVLVCHDVSEPVLTCIKRPVLCSGNQVQRQLNGCLGKVAQPLPEKESTVDLHIQFS